MGESAGEREARERQQVTSPSSSTRRAQVTSAGLAEAAVFGLLSGLHGFRALPGFVVGLHEVHNLSIPRNKFRKSARRVRVAAEDLMHQSKYFSLSQLADRQQ